MSPEQLQGKEADARSDIFAFGCVLYEMLSGKKAFQGSTTASVIATIMEREPEPLQTTPPLDRVIRTCLEKDPDKRFQGALDLRRNLLWAMETTVAAAPVKAAGSARGWIPAFAVIAVLLAGVSFVYFREKPAGMPVVKTEINPPEKTSFSGDGWMALSPDGRKLVFSAVSADGENQLWLRSLDAVQAQPIAGTENGLAPFWSPDSRSIGFFNGSSLKRVDLAGGPALTLAPATSYSVASGAWGADGTILFNPLVTSALLKISSNGGPTAAVTRTAGGSDNLHHGPWFLPDGRHFLFWAGNSGFTRGRIRVGSLDSNGDSNDAPLLTEADSAAVYADEHLLFLRGTTLMAQPFNEKTLKLSGEAVPVAGQVRNSMYSAFSVSKGGDLVYAGGAAAGEQLTWVGRDGKREGTLGEPGQLVGPAFSPDRKRLSVGISDPASGNADIWIYDVERGLRTRFTFDPAAEQLSIWSPDGGAIVFNSLRKGPGDLYRKRSDGSGVEELLYADGLRKVPTSWSPDGRFLLYYAAGDPKSGSEIWVLPDPLGAPGGSKPYPFLRTQFNELQAHFSPDGRWVAYQSDESGQYEIYLAPFPGPGGKRQISTGGGRVPRWRGDGKEIFYSSLSGQMMATEVSENKDELAIGGTAGPFFGGMPVARGMPYDVAADGKRFIALVPPEQGSSAPLTLVQNWAAGLGK